MISILMPLYNGIEFLEESICSIREQTFAEWELLIGINGCSDEDATRIVNIVNSFTDSRIKISSFPFKGKTKTLNALIKKTSFNYICLIDVDDCWSPKKLEHQLKYIKRYDVVGTDTEYFGDITGSPGIFLGKLSLLMFSFQNPVINSSVMFRKSDVQWDEKWEGLDDYSLWISLLNQRKTFYNIPMVLTKHRIHKNSYYNNHNNIMLKQILREKILKLSKLNRHRLGFILSNKRWKLDP